jgi:3-hydroxyisobutyrate dehydrogenase-like beta-hydroxyacid dehydrogenase
VVTHMDSANGMTRRVGYVGLGNMGGPMARNLARAGVDLAVYDRRDEAVDELVALGARRADSVGALAAQVDVLLTCVLYDSQVKEIFDGPDGIIENGLPGLIVTVHSTISPDTVQEVSERARTVGIRVLDAPVSGASIASEKGTLTIMVGGDESALEDVRPILSIIGEHIIHVGAPGMGQTAKLANNIMALGNQLVAMEAIRFGEAFGLEREALLRVAEVSTGASWMSSNYAHFDRFGVEHTLAGTPELPHRLGKDLRYAVGVAQDRWTYLPITSLCSQLLPAMFAERWKRNEDEAAAASESAGGPQ